MDAKSGNLARKRYCLEIWTRGLLCFLVLQAALLAWALAGCGFLLAAVAGWLFLFWFTPSTISTRLLQTERARRLSPVGASPLTWLAADVARRGQLTQLPRLYLMPSPWLNAFTLDSPQGPSIVLSAGLLRHLNLYELTGVLAHEMSHIRGGDIRMVGLAVTCSRVTRWLSLLGVALLALDRPATLMANRGWVILLVLTAPLLAELAQLALSRAREFHADLDAADMLADPGPLIAALSRMAEWEACPPLPWCRSSSHPSVLLRTHPATRQRIERLRRLQAPAPPLLLVP